MIFKGSELVEKKNMLNELRSNNMTLQELRFFSIYLSKINARDKSTRVVRFSLDDFRRIMDIGEDMNMPHFRMTIQHILQQIVEVPLEKGCGYTAFQLFKEFTLLKDENGEWYVEIDAHDKALPLMFDLKNRYFSYELWNALRLKSPNQVRMYEILKQYEKVGKRELTIKELRDLLGIKPTEYPRWNNFKMRVLDGCQKALKENTDICYTYEHGKVGTGGKWLTVIFNIKKNDSYVDQLTLYEFMEEPPSPKVTETTVDGDDDETEENFFSDACDNEFTNAEMEYLLSALRTVPANSLPKLNFTDSIDIRRYHYLEQQYKAMMVYDKRSKIKNHLKYLIKMLQNNTEE